MERTHESNSVELVLEHLELARTLPPPQHSVTETRQIVGSWLADAPRRRDLQVLAALLASADAVGRALRSVLSPAAGRPSVLLHDDDVVTVYLLGWRTGDHTFFHDHGGSSGGVHVLRGEIDERCWRSGSPTSQVVSAGRGFSFGATHVHDICNRGTGHAVSIHVYSPPLRSMTFYAEADGRLTAITRLMRSQWMAPA